MTRPPERDSPFVGLDLGRDDAPLVPVGPSFLEETINRQLREATGRPGLHGRFDTRPLLHARRRPPLDDRSTTPAHGDPLRSSMPPRRSPLAKLAAAIRAADAPAFGLGLSPLLGPPVEVRDERHVWDDADLLRAGYLVRGLAPPAFPLVTSDLCPPGSVLLVDYPFGGPTIVRPPAPVPGFSRYTLGAREADRDRRRARGRR